MTDLRMFGNVLDVLSRVEDGKIKRYKVEKIYPLCVECKDESGFTTCFSLGDLVTMGVLKSTKLNVSWANHTFRGWERG